MSKVLVLKTVNEDMTTFGNFLWKEKGVVKAPDWNPRLECGGGLHGYLWGEGSGVFIRLEPDAKWLVLSVEESDIVDLEGCCVKFPKCSVVYCGDRIGATEKILKKRPESVCIGASKNVGDRKTVIVGAHGTATAGNYGTATAGNYGTATAGSFGTATAGDSGFATAVYNGTATAGEYGIATAGKYGTATAGGCGTATVAEYGIAKVGKGGSVRIEYWDGGRCRTLVGYEGEDIEADVFYEVGDGKFVKVWQRQSSRVFDI